MPPLTDSDAYTQPWDLRSAEDIAPTFANLEASGTFKPGSIESQYAALFFDAMSEGTMSDGERERLDHAAHALGITEEGRAALEEGWHRAYQGSAALGRPGDATRDDALPRVFKRNVRRPFASLLASNEPDPDVPALVELFEQAGLQGDDDARFRIGSLLARREGTPVDALLALAELKPKLVSTPLRSMDEDLWLELIDPPDWFLRTAHVFREISAAALLARASAFKLDGRKLATAQENLATTKVSAVRAFAWCAAHLGLPCPALHVDRDAPIGLDFVPTLPPSVVVGRGLLAAEPFEVAFECARHLTLHRPDHFMTLLVPDVASLDDVLNAALLMVHDDINIPPDALARASLNRDALKPALDPDSLRELRRAVSALLAYGIPDLDAWVDIVERAADRMGLLIGGDLDAAARVLLREPDGPHRVRELEAFWIGKTASKLRRALGIEITNPVLIT